MHLTLSAFVCKLDIVHVFEVARCVMLFTLYNLEL